jgi:hypothetical protein
MSVIVAVFGALLISGNLYGIYDIVALWYGIPILVIAIVAIFLAWRFLP